MRFACDVMLGKLAKYLRIFGFDTVYLRNMNLLEDYARQEDPPYFITRRKQTLPYNRTIHVNSEDAPQQLKELWERIKSSFDPEKALARCIYCNLLLLDVDKEAIEHRVPEFVFHSYTVFKLCPGCKRVYWAGTHTERMKQLIEEMNE